jgi:hypothetical protein
MIRHGCPATRSFRVSWSADDDVISLYHRRGCRKIRIQMIDDNLPPSLIGLRGLQTVDNGRNKEAA